MSTLSWLTVVLLAIIVAFTFGLVIMGRLCSRRGSYDVDLTYTSRRP